MANKKKKGRDLWVIEFTSIDSSQDSIVAYESRKEAVGVAVDFIQDEARRWLEELEWEPGDQAPEMLEGILKSVADKKFDEAIVGWLEYQGEYEPDERIAIGPSGSVSDSPGDFPFLRRER